MAQPFSVSYIEKIAKKTENADTRAMTEKSTETIRSPLRGGDLTVKIKCE